MNGNPFRRLAVIGVAALALVAWTPLAASASPLALDFTGGLDGFYCTGSAGCTVGWTFSTNANVEVDGFGVFDGLANGFTDAPHAVGIWDSTGTLLATAVVDNSSTPTASTSALGDWMVQSISPIVLGNGTYTIGAYFNNLSPDTFVGDALAATIPAVSFGIPVAGFNSSLIQPTIDYSIYTNGFFGVTFTGTEVPEPTTWLLLGTGLVGAIRRRARRS